ncbi:PREDICTED: rho GTPase-activating protein 29-like [Elephantulus edwardii]|uniref:rho GTPase-activating protein 29-like n=1 Tax=Elephantulus edwardii TaxID=28737 RepID=UPI0003F07B2A|nr:PREDICTED: rho GTPase-activating protein 29-like [Elephantulus edwardii]
MNPPKSKKSKKKRVISVTPTEMGSVSSNSGFDADSMRELVSATRKFSQMLIYFREAILSECFREVIYVRLDELLLALKSVMTKYQSLNSVDLQNAADMLIAKVKAVNFKKINEENKNDTFQEVFSSIEALAFTFGKILTNFLMGDLGNVSVLQLPVSQECKSLENISVGSVDSSSEKGNLSPIELDNVLVKNSDCVELALSYAKTWSKYTKNIVSWVEKKLNLELESTRNIVKLAEATRANIGLHEFMPLKSLFTSALLNDIQSSQLLQETIAALQANKFVQPLLGRKNEMEKQRKEVKELWKEQQNKMLETETALKKAKLLCIQRQDEYEKAKSSMSRAEEEHLASSGGLAKSLNKQLEKKRKLEEEALQKVEEANELYKICMTHVEERRNDLENTKREVLAQLRTLVFQCDLTLKAVSFENTFLCKSQYFISSVISSSTSWTFGMFSDSESTGGSSESRSLDSESVSPGDFHRKLPRTPSSGTMSSADDLDEREPPSPSETGLSSLGPFKKILMSKSALTHKFRKLRSPNKCRDCESIVVFHGFECEECLLVCHRKCLENIVILCGHEKLMGKMSLFGVEFTQVANREPDGIPFLLKMCALEIENRALCLQGIYRVSGNKVKIEKLCQAFENGMNLVDISEFGSHDICEVLKSYLRQLPEPLILFRLYKECMDLSKELQNISEELELKKDGPQDKKWPSACIEINRIILKSKDLLRQLPAPNFNSLHYLIMHLKRYGQWAREAVTAVGMSLKIVIETKDAENLSQSHSEGVADYAEKNKMNSKNLGLIFGPCLIKPRPTTAPITINSLTEYSHQARLVEFLITYSQKIFDGPLQPQTGVVDTAGVVDPEAEISSLPKTVVPPEERDSEHLMKPLFYSSKEDIHTTDSESKSLEPFTSFGESDRKQNSFKKCTGSEMMIKGDSEGPPVCVDVSPRCGEDGDREEDLVSGAQGSRSYSHKGAKAQRYCLCSRKDNEQREQGQPDGNPACQRPRLKRMQQFEDLQDELPQFV